MGSELQKANSQNKLALWAERVSVCRNSGLSVRDWCKENSICEQTYYRWQRKLYGIAQAQQEQTHFAEITPIRITSDNTVVTVRIAGVEIDIQSGSDEETVRMVLRIHRSATWNRWPGLYGAGILSAGSLYQYTVSVLRQTP